MENNRPQTIEGETPYHFGGHFVPLLAQTIVTGGRSSSTTRD